MMNQELENVSDELQEQGVNPISETVVSETVQTIENSATAPVLDVEVESHEMSEEEHE